jgi:hypothetical protein
MKNFNKIIFLLFLSVVIAFSQEASFNGKWKLMKNKGSDLDYFPAMTIDFSINKNELTINTFLGPKRKYEENMIVPLNGKTVKVEIKDRSFYTNLYMGLRLPPKGIKEVSAGINLNILTVNEKIMAQTSQGEKSINIIHTYTLSDDKNIITYTIKRDSRKTGPETKYILKRADYNNAWVMKMSDDWNINSKLPEQACLISLQGIINEEKPNLYFIYGKEWDFNYTEELYKYLEDGKYFTFNRLNSLEQALGLFKEKVKGYIVWDKNVRTSLIVSFTLAGLEKGIVITEEMIPLAEKYGLKPIDDFRGKFTGKTDYEIYSWAKDKYWHRCSREYIVWLGGEHGNIMKPGIADFGMVKKMFFSDLSAKIKDTLEYGLTNQLLSEMKPLSLVMGWHSYKKDLEEEWTSVTSSHALTIEGLHSLPNISFLNKVPATPGFQYKNHHNIEKGKIYTPQKKVYIAFIQTDGLGIGAWVKPGRGTLPYAWEVSMNYKWMAPSMLEYFYAQATPNDYFIGALSGSGYMYPKAFPKKWLPKEIEKAKNMMMGLDLNVFETMDYSGDRMEASENNLTKEITDEYYKGMPEAIGFVNGYFAAHTFTVKNKKPFVSYDYYLSAEKSEEEAVADLKELADINSLRPYFFLVHVRQYSDVSRVKSIADKLGPDFEIIPLDIYLKMAGENPTFKERYMDKE